MEGKIRRLRIANDSLTYIGARNAPDQLAIFNDRQQADVHVDHNRGGFRNVILWVKHNRFFNHKGQDRKLRKLLTLLEKESKGGIQ